MSLESDAKAVGRHKGYFAQLKSLKYPLWYKFKSLDDNLVVAYRKYEKEQNEVKDSITKIYYELVDDKKLHFFSNWLIGKIPAYRCSNTFYESINATMGSYSDKFLRLGTLDNYKLVIKLYEEYKNVK